MSSLQLPARRPGWSAPTERLRATEGQAWQDAYSWLVGIYESWLPSCRAHLPPPVDKALHATLKQLVHADAATFQKAVQTVRTELMRKTCIASTLGRALAIVGLTLQRTLGKSPYNTQYLAAWLILQGRLAEMATGEGKTLAAAMAAAVAGLAQVPVHLLTANDYLVQRDSQGLINFFSALGLRVGCVLSSMGREERAKAYLCDITFVTAKELAFDYLKDHLLTKGDHDPRVLRAKTLGNLAGAHGALGEEHAAPVLPGLHMAIVDEADACLLDEAIMPLILAQQGASVNVPAYSYAYLMSTTLHQGSDYQLRQGLRCALLTPAGRLKVDDSVLSICTQQPHLSNGLNPPQRAYELVESALTARFIIHRDRDYAVFEDGIQMIDEVTGRIAVGRQWSSALQQMIELKEGLEPKPSTVVVAQITFQRFFPRYLHLGGMSGTLTEAQRELRSLYGRGVTKVPLKHASRRLWLGETLYINAAAKWSAVVAAIATMLASGRPVLVGTDSVADSGHLSALLGRSGIHHQVLNAVQDAHEAQCIAKAGQLGVVTVATNMAGRGTDIHLEPRAKAAGGLHVIACMRNSSRRIDRQLIGRCARHGDPGSAQRMVALDDFILQRGLPAWLRSAAGASTVVMRRNQVPQPLARILLAIAQWRAHSIESQRRKQLRHAERQLDDVYGFAGPTE